MRLIQIIILVTFVASCKDDVTKSQSSANQATSLDGDVSELFSTLYEDDDQAKILSWPQIFEPSIKLYKSYERSVDGEVVQSQKRTFKRDNQGRVKEYTEAETQYGRTLSYTNTYGYNTDGSLAKIINNYENKDGTTSVHSVNYSYGQDGEILVYESAREDGVEKGVLKYDSQKRVISITNTRTKDKEEPEFRGSFKITYETNSLLEIEELGSDSAVVSRKEYDLLGNTVTTKNCPESKDIRQEYAILYFNISKPIFYKLFFKPIAVGNLGRYYIDCDSGEKIDAQPYKSCTVSDKGVYECQIDPVEKSGNSSFMSGSKVHEKHQIVWRESDVYLPPLVSLIRTFSDETEYSDSDPIESRTIIESKYNEHFQLVNRIGTFSTTNIDGSTTVRPGSGTSVTYDDSGLNPLKRTYNSTVDGEVRMNTESYTY